MPNRHFDDPQESLFGSSDIPLPTDTELRDQLGQFMTPRWAAELLLERLGTPVKGDVVLEPSCGRGAWLHAVNRVDPAHEIDVRGIEIDPKLAAVAAHDTGRPITIGDYTTIQLDFEPTIVVGNPPYQSDLIASFISKSAASLAPAPNSRIGFLLPVHSFSFASRTLEILKGLDVTVEIVPRDLYPRISFPLLFCKLTKSTQQKLIGFALFEEAIAIRTMRAEYRRVIQSGRKPIWREITEMALKALGGEASLEQIYDVVEDFRGTSTNRFWRDRVRAEAGEHFERVSTGVFRLPKAA
jgi:site-specific DNA-methyltransferase (adenine-specific)